MERLQKIIAKSSEYSRRKAEQLIVEGRVKVNGKVVLELGTKASFNDEILIDGNVITRQEKVYYLLNKPIKTICSTNDEHDRTTVVDLVHDDNVYPVGRLDYYTSGLLLLTNDGALANGLMHPSKEVLKTYRVKVDSTLEQEDIRQLIKGVDIGDYITKKAQVSQRDATTFEITITEGKNRQIRRMLETLGYEIVNLKRIKYAIFDIELEKIKPGQSRLLHPKEIKQLYNLSGISHE